MLTLTAIDGAELSAHATTADSDERAVTRDFEIWRHPTPLGGRNVFERAKGQLEDSSTRTRRAGASLGQEIGGSWIDRQAQSLHVEGTEPAQGGYKSDDVSFDVYCPQRWRPTSSVSGGA